MIRRKEKSFNKHKFNENSIFKKIVDDIVEDCNKLDISVEYNVVLLAVHLFALHPEYNVDNFAMFNHKNMDYLIRKCISVFSGQYNLLLSKTNVKFNDPHRSMKIVAILFFDCSRNRHFAENIRHWVKYRIHNCL